MSLTEIPLWNLSIVELVGLGTGQCGTPSGKVLLSKCHLLAVSIML